MPSDDLSPQTLSEIEGLLRQGQKISAIKVFREATGVGLAEAKAAVEEIERGLGSASPASADGLAPQSLAQIEALLREGRKIMAIKAYRRLTGVGLAEAKTAVEAMERGAGIDAGRNSEAELSPQTLAEIQRLHSQYQKTFAAIAYRKATGVSPAEAKAAVEAMERDGGLDSAGDFEPDLTPQTLSELESLLFQGRKIVAVKVFREAAGCSLAEAKEAVEDLERDLRARRPEEFQAAVGPSPLAAVGAFALLLLLGGIAAILLLPR